MAQRGPLNARRGSVPQRAYGQRGKARHERRAAAAQGRTVKAISLPYRKAAQSIQQTVSKPAVASIKPPKPKRVMSEAASTALDVIGGWRVVRAVNGWAYYYTDAMLRGIEWIEKRVMDELKSFKAVREMRGVFVTAQQYKLAKVTP